MSPRHRVKAERGWYNLAQAYAYSRQQPTTSRADELIVRQEQVRITPKNQFATEMDYLSTCILEDNVPYSGGEEGIQDQRIMEAIYQSARERRPIPVPIIEHKDAFRGRSRS